MIKEGNSGMFSNEAQISEKAVIAEKKLIRLRNEMKDEDDCIITGNYYEKLPKLKINFQRIDFRGKFTIHILIIALLIYLLKRLCAIKN